MLIAAFSLLVLFFTDMLAYAEDQVGRYQLFQGEYRCINLLGEECFEKALLKIDTVTGKLYVCEEKQVRGKHIQKEGDAYLRRYCTDFEQEIKIPDYSK
jgi:hypothetical protein